MILKVPNFKELLIELNIDPKIIENITRFSLDDYKLTFAEAVLLYEGTSLGIADCRISAGEIEKKNLSIYNLCISGEFLELLLMPKISKILFSTDKLIIQGANIYRRTDIIRLTNNAILKENYALNIHDTAIDLDIIFRDCIFGGGLNLQNSQTKSLTFERVKIYKSQNLLNSKWESFSGMNLKINGSLVFTNRHTESHSKQEITLSTKISHGGLPKEEITNSEVDTESSSLDRMDLSYYSANINLQNARITDQLEFQDIKLSEGIDCTNIRATGIVSENCYMQHDWILSGAIIQNLFEITNLRTHASINCYNLKAYQLFIRTSVIQKSLHLTFAKIEHLFACTDTLLIGGSDRSSMDFSNSYSLNARGMVAGNIFLREGFVAANGVDLLRCDIKDGIDFSESLIVANLQDGIAVNLSGSRIASDVQFSSEAIFMGSISLDESNIGGNITFYRSKFINTIGGPYTISAKNARVAKSIRFSPSNIIKQSRYEKHLLDRKSEEDISALIPHAATVQRKIVAARAKLYRNNDRIVFNYLKDITHTAKENFSHELYKEQDHYFEVLKKDETFIENALSCYDKALQYLHFTAEKESKCLLPENKLFELILENTVVIGETFFSGIHVCGQADFSGALFYAMDKSIGNDKTLTSTSIFRSKKINKKEEDFPNALTMKFSRIDGELFLNEGSKKNNLPFRVCGEVNLHSSKIGQLFISPGRGIEDNAKWKIIGVKYNYIYSSESYAETSLLELCKWFHNYNEENNRQPYEELAAAYLRAGDDTKARKVLLRTVPRNTLEKISTEVLKTISRLGIPHYRSLIALLILYISGCLVFYRAAHTGAIIPLNRFPAAVEITQKNSNAAIYFSPSSYSYQSLFPFLSSEQKQAFAIANHSNQNFFPSWMRVFLDSGSVVSVYASIHMFAGVLFLSMFIIGITRIIKRH
ncbi:hypothetical protein KK062_12050 [Fulvivirgaceae bacterium PWU5]|uniref:Uncharacterized protein n=1 Tax=Dawidia cretensis TaxID=2782350 RepID=A0AAP2DZ85_9BACT|nr:hypothetical protein [Dawidia cretensis]MBT1708963.1 hypothetical protein [Dawidia cretensis]